MSKSNYLENSNTLCCVVCRNVNCFCTRNSCHDPPHNPCSPVCEAAMVLIDIPVQHTHSFFLPQNILPSPIMTPPPFFNPPHPLLSSPPCAIPPLGANYMGMMNILMQLRKVCNHPDLFEPRPITSPFVGMILPTHPFNTPYHHILSTVSPFSYPYHSTRPLFSPLSPSFSFVDQGFLYTPGNLVTHALDTNPLNKLSDYIMDLWGGYDYDLHARDEMTRLRPSRRGKTQANNT